MLCLRVHFISTALCPENDSITLPCLCFRAQQSHKDGGQWRRPLPWSGMCQCGLGTWASKLILTNHFLGRQTNLNKPFSCRQGTLNGCVFFIASMQMCVATVQCQLGQHHKYLNGYHHPPPEEHLLDQPVGGHHPHLAPCVQPVQLQLAGERTNSSNAGAF